MRLKAPDEEIAFDMRHHCIDALARKNLDPTLCAYIKQLNCGSNSSAADLYQDRCRAWSISREEQCFTGLLTESWREGVAEDCFRYLAVNQLDGSICQNIQEPEERSYCHEAVEQASDTLY